MCKERLELLQNLFENVNTWLHFVEAKNAALIAFNIALLAALISSNLSDFNITFFSAIVVGILISILLSLYSFNPKNKFLEKTRSMGIDANLLHYAYIASLTQDEYIKKLYALYWNDANINLSTVPQIEKDYTAEIIQNSRIAMKKQSFFRLAFAVDFFMIVATAILVVCA